MTTPTTTPVVKDDVPVPPPVDRLGQVVALLARGVVRRLGGGSEVRKLDAK
jgi:hypothetical protein